MRSDIEYVRSLESRLVELRTAADLADAEYRDEIARLRLTDEEREAVAYFAAFHQSPREADASAAATLRSLLERLQRLGPAANSPPIPRTGCGECLTDAEREAVENCIYASERIGDDWSDKQAALLRGLLERH